MLSDELYCNICSSNIDPSEVDEHITSSKHVKVKNKILEEFKKLLADAETTEQSVYLVWKE